MKSPGNGRDFHKFSAAGTAAAAAVLSVRNSDSNSVNDCAIFGCLSPIRPVNISPVESDFSDFSFPPIFSLPHLNPFQQVSQMRRLNDECVPNPKGSHKNDTPLGNLVNTYLVSPVPANGENPSRLVNSISNYPGSDLIPTPCDDKNDQYGFANCIDISSSDNYPVEPDSKEVYQQGHGHRRLQFANAEHPIPYHSFNKNMNSSSSRANPADPKVIESSNTAPAATNRCRSPVFSTVSKPTGFGLHLNSLCSSMTPNRGVTVRMKTTDKDCYSLQPNNNLFIPSSSEPEKIESSTLNIVNPVSEYDSSDQGKSPSEFDMNQVNRPKKRKRVADENDGCKRCNCKKTKCLKLYCDCFAAGVYCAETCTCQDCFNRPGYEGTVIETRQHIESRNPLAFAPKVVQQYSKSPAVSNREDATNLSTPSSARHKRGCNCKKSMCLKKYCECYQANVGCSDGCRCEDCKNSFGKKEDYVLTEDVVAEGTINETSGSTHDQIAYQNRISCSPCNSTSLAPTFLDTGNEFATTAAAQSLEQFGSSQFTSSPPAPLTMPVFDNPNILMCPENTGFSSTGSTQWRCSSMTRLTQFCGMKILREDDSDDTPDILKDNYNNNHHSLNSTKVRSPNKKRVSPPQINHGSSSLPALRSSRKFILQSVPSFPTLVPCNKPRDDDVTRK